MYVPRPIQWIRVVYIFHTENKIWYKYPIHFLTMLTILIHQFWNWKMYDTELQKCSLALFDPKENFYDNFNAIAELAKGARLKK